MGKAKLPQYVSPSAVQTNGNTEQDAKARTAIYQRIFLFCTNNDKTGKERYTIKSGGKNQYTGTMEKLITLFENARHPVHAIVPRVR